jgi:predicted peptidase
MNRYLRSFLSLIVLFTCLGRDFSKPTPLLAGDAHPRLEQYQARTITMSDGFTMPYRLYRPSESTSKTLPLLLLLHSITERGSDNLKPYEFFQPYLTEALYEKDPSFIVIPQCPRWHYWWDTKPNEAMLALIPALLKEFPDMDRTRIYVTGVSLGAYEVYNLLAELPNCFAAAVPICGDPGPSPLKAPNIKDLPIWIFHGAKDPRVNVSGDRKLVAELNAMGSHPHYTEYPDGGHRIWKDAYASPVLWDWLFSQHKDQ